MNPSPKLSARQRRIKDNYGPWAVVTGASSGIGLSLTRHIASCGLNVGLVARRADLLTDQARALETDYGIKTRVVAADLTDPNQSIAQMSPFEDVDVGLFAGAAGFGTSGNFTETDLEEELNMIALNCASSFALTRHFAAPMITRGRGGLILFSSLVAFQGVARAANYAATKAYIQVLAEGIERELTSHNVDVLATAPGPVETGFAARADLVMNGASSADAVAAETLYALGRRATVRPAFFNRFLQTSLSTLPRTMRARILQQVFKGMTKHQT